MGQFVLPVHYPSVRRVIDVTLDATLLPDAVIADPVFLDAAEAEVLALDPDAASRSGSQQTMIRNAAIYLTAARILPALPRIIGERFVDWSEQRQPLDVEATVADLRGRALALVRDVLGQARRKTPGFALAAGRRGA